MKIKYTTNIHNFPPCKEHNVQIQMLSPLSGGRKCFFIDFHSSKWIIIKNHYKDWSISYLIIMHRIFVRDYGRRLEESHGNPFFFLFWWRRRRKGVGGRIWAIRRWNLERIEKQDENLRGTWKTFQDPKKKKKKRKIFRKNDNWGVSKNSSSEQRNK